MAISNENEGLIGTSPCGNYTVKAGVGAIDDGFQTVPASTIQWKDWSRVGMDLTPYINQTINIRFETRDCSLGGHYGYAYISAGVFDPTIIVDVCSGQNEVTLPEHFESYLWNTGDTGIDIGVSPGELYSCVIKSENGCTVTVDVEAEATFEPYTEYISLQCGDEDQLIVACLDENPDATFSWTPTTGLSSDSDPSVNVLVTPELYNSTQNYTLETYYLGDTLYSYHEVSFQGDILTAGNDKNLNCGATAILGPCGPFDGATYSWEPSTGLFNEYGNPASNIANPIVKEVPGLFPSQDYELTVTYQGNDYTDIVTVNFNESIFEAGPDVSLYCGESAVIGPCIEVPGATYNWVSLGNNPSLNINDPSLVNPTVSIGVTANMETIYELTITLADGTEVTDQVMISLLSDPAYLGGNILSVCGPVDLEPCTILNGASYEWWPPEGLSNTTGPITTVTPYLGMTYPSIYNLKVTEADGTEHNGVVSVDYEAPASEIIDLTIVPELENGDINNCKRFAQNFTATGGPSDMVYDWEIISESSNPQDDIYEFMENDFLGAATNGSDVSIQFYDFNEEFIFLRVIGTSASQPCFYGEGIIKVYYCCFRPDMLNMEGDYNISNLVDSTDAFNSITIGLGQEITVMDQYILIDGTLHIDQNTNWLECEVKFEEDARIIVENNISFKVRDSYLSACSDMWDGIYVLDSSSYLLMAQDTVFDAHQAVFSKNGGQMYLENTDFTDNNRSVVIKDFQANMQFPYHPSTIENCKFLVDSMHAPLADQIPFAGIEIENVEKYTFDPTGELDIFAMATPLFIPSYYLDGTGNQPARNYFEGLENGINMINTEKSEIRENEFVKCNTGIRVENSVSDVFHSNAFLGFPNAYYQGMRMNNIEDDRVYLSYFKDCVGGIVASNDPSFWLTGYQVAHLVSGTTTNDYGNYFVGEGSAHRINYMRVKVEGNSIYQGRSRFSNVKRGSKIRYNKIHNISNGNAAIQIQNYMLMPYGNDVDVVGNNIRVDVHGMGIWMRNVNSFNTADALEDPTNENHQVAIVENNVTLNGMNDDISYGIRIENCNGIITGYNNVSNTGFPNTLAQTLNLRGLSIAQTQEAYIMANTFTRVGLGIRGIGDLIGSEYDCNIFEQNYHGMYFEGSLENPTAFTSISAQGDFDGFAGFEYNPQNNEWYDAPYSDSRIGGGADNFPAVDWYWKNDNPTIYEHNEVPGMNEVGYPGDIHDCDETAPEEWTADVTYSALESIASETNTYQNMQDQAQYYDNNFAYRVLRENPGIRNPETASGLVLYNFYELLDNSNFREFYDITQHVRAGELEDALTKNAAVLSDLLIEQNLKQVNTIYINQLINEVDTLTLDERDLLESIAYTTPYLGGDAVYTARAMLDIDPDDMGVAYRQAAPVADEISKIVLYPNPSSGKLTLTFDTPSDKKGIFECYDIQAKLLKSGTLNAFETTHQVDLSELSAGLYFVRVLKEDEVLLNEKLIMTK